jgi:hypothetical protein
LKEKEKLSLVEQVAVVGLGLERRIKQSLISQIYRLGIGTIVHASFSDVKPGIPTGINPRIGSWNPGTDNPDFRRLSLENCSSIIAKITIFFA